MYYNLHIFIKYFPYVSWAFMRNFITAYRVASFKSSWFKTSIGIELIKRTKSFNIANFSKDCGTKDWIYGRYSIIISFLVAIHESIFFSMSSKFLFVNSIIDISHLILSSIVNLGTGYIIGDLGTPFGRMVSATTMAMVSAPTAGGWYPTLRWWWYQHLWLWGYLYPWGLGKPHFNFHFYQILL